MKKWLLPYVSAGSALVVLWFFVIFSPLYQELTSLEVRAGESRQQLEDFRKSLEELPQFLQARERLRAQKADLRSKLYTKSDILRLFEQLRQQAESENLTITEIIPPIEELLELNRVIPDSTQPLFLNISLRLAGDYIRFGKFVGRVEHSSYFRGINDCRITGGQEVSDDLQLQIGFTALLGSARESA
jgi:Tfp pilus assembly protein PilO